MDKLVRITTVPLSLDKLLEGQMGFMKTRGMDVAMVSSDGPRREAIAAREGCPYYVVSMTRVISPVRDLVSVWRMVRLFRSLRPDIVHTHTPKAGLVGMMAAWWCRVPVRMHTVAGLPLMESTGMRRRLLVLVEKITYGFSSGVYPNSYRLLQYISDQRFCRPGKLKVIASGSSNGIDAHYFSRTPELEARAEEVRKTYGIPGDAFVFVFIGRIVRDKGIQELVAACKPLKAHLLLVGPFEDDLDPVDDACREEIERNPSIHVTGYQQDVRPFLVAADVLAFPSYREGFPNVPLQAGCLGLPSIVSDINGCNEIVEEGINGLVVPAKDTNALRRALERMIDEPGLRDRCAKNARDRITGRYGREVVWDALHREYQEQKRRAHAL
ncbi:glycosyltransferase family 4 protein [Dinghuibacter silviterrae]|uniref:Glycosyltransferase involved in cell wall biosynthesis n=1 Tax=Dinghuibacter silviterrae TaxID=1539049 RepID=A0A4R8DRR4_9BACT|nr:glycosyltransferase family 4 protein [Dinghuibacter silviterrae]TDX00047.1 glycosyltransferase involved in cell wall biosynthesis [Dinghuibacter silviterrae]